MKISLIILFVLTTTISYSQTKIKFSINGNQPRTSDKITQLKLPIDLEFTKYFKDSTINILNNSNEIIALKNGKSGDGQLTLLNDTFVIAFENNGNVNPPTAGDKKIEGKTIKLKIGNSIPIVLSFDNGKSDEDNSGESYQPGYFYYDAIKLSDTKVDIAVKRKILISYGITDFKDTISNPFLKEIIKNADKMNVIQGSGNGFGALLSNIGNTDVTYFAAGLARFLAERTKEELNEAFFSKMKEQLNAYPELKTVFPKTASFLDVIETYSYASVIQVLKESFETDIQNLPENLYSVKYLTATACDEKAICGKNILGDDKKDCDNYKDCKTRLDNLKKFFESQDGRWIGLGMFTVKEAIQSSNPADLLKSITGSSELSGIKQYSKDSLFANYNIASSIELGNLISQSLLSKTENQIWINKKQLDSLINTPNTFRTYLGLLLAYEQMGKTKIEFYTENHSTLTFGNILKKADSTYSKYESDLKGLIINSQSAFNSANNAVKKMIAATDKSVEADPQALYNYYRTFTASLKPIAHSPLLDSITKIHFGEKYDIVENYLNPSVDIAYHIATKKYSAAIYDAVTLLNNAKKPVFEKPVTKSFIKYGTLISTVANAQSSDEVKQALDASVLPVGSSAIKRKSAWSISVNGYVGGFYGKAHTTSQDTVRNISNKLDTVNNKVSYTTFGLYAPVGLSFNRGFKCGWGVTLSAQILDLGALVNFYLKEGDQAALPTDFKVKLSDILSPGLQLALNIPKTPLTIMGGVQYVPALHSTSQISTSSQPLSPIAWRGQIGIVVDIPLYNLKVWDFKK
ncbi:MAG: hypothetical protein ABI851_15750 [Saprospiraceae bacterium]